MFRGALIGINGIGKWHGEMMRDTRRVDVVAVCDINENLRAAAEEKFPGAAFFTDVDDMLERSSPDLVAIATPHNLHAPLAIRCSRAGANVIVEKPMATTYGDCCAMIEAAEEAERFLTVFHNRRLDPWFVAAMDVIRAGWLGRLFEINVAIASCYKSTTWRGYMESCGGIMFDWGAHLIDYALHFDPSDVQAVSGVIYRAQDTAPDEIADHGVLRMWMSSGATAQVSVSRRDYEGRGYRYRLLGESGSLIDRWNWGGEDKLEVYTRLAGGEATRMEVAYKKSNAQQFYDNVIEHMGGKAELMVSPQSAAKVINILCTAQRSSDQGGRPLELE